MSNFDNKTELSPRVKNTVLVVFLLTSIGSLILILSGFFDLTSHLRQTPETFLTPEHILLYTGI